jgi:small subunit ribosomal protein S6
MREYEITYLVSDEVLENDLNKVTGKVSAVISDAQGKIKKEEVWGRRKLAYPIRKQNFANYVTLSTELPSEQIANIDRELRLMPQVLRHLLIIKSTSEEQLEVTKEDVVADEELEKVIGEKSVEIIAGETEESYELMAKREPTEEKTETEQETEEITKDQPVPEKEEKVTVEKTKKRSRATIKEEKTEEPTEKKVKETKELTKEETTIKEDEGKKKTSKAKTTINKKTVEKAVETKEDEADRIKKLDEKLDELLKDDL